MCGSKWLVHELFIKLIDFFLPIRYFVGILCSFLMGLFVWVWKEKSGILCLKFKVSFFDWKFQKYFLVLMNFIIFTSPSPVVWTINYQLILNNYHIKTVNPAQILNYLVTTTEISTDNLSNKLFFIKYLWLIHYSCTER